MGITKCHSKTALFGKVRWHNHNGPFWPCNLQTLITVIRIQIICLLTWGRKSSTSPICSKTSAISQPTVLNAQDFHRPQKAQVQQHLPVAFTRMAGQIQPDFPHYAVGDRYKCSIWGGNMLCVDYSDRNNVGFSFHPSLNIVEETQNPANTFLQSQSSHFSK